MNLAKLNPWNWFKDEDQNSSSNMQIPVTKKDSKLSAVPISHSNPLIRLHQEMERAFEEIFSAFGLASGSHSDAWINAFDKPLSPYARPNIDISGDSQSYQISLDVPGINQADLSIELEGDNLVIRGEREEKHEQNDKQFYRMERSYGAFQRRLNLPGDANKDEIAAKLENGVLKLEIPRTEMVRENVKRIEINT